MDIFALLPTFGGFLYTALAFVVALSIIVAVHEYGHYIVGRWSGIHAEVFSLGFGPVLAKWHDKRGTQWQVAALPLGGYVKFLGDADAASGKDAARISEMDTATLRRTMHSAPLWARAATVAAGPVFNFALSIIVFAAVIGFQGQASDPLTVQSLRPMPATQQLQPGDEILAIDGIRTPPLEEFESLVSELPEEATLSYEVRRDGGVETVEGPYPYPPLVVSVSPGSAAMEAGIQIGDVITAVDGANVNTFGALRDAVEGSGGAPLSVTLWRDGETLERTLTPKRADLPVEGGFETRWLIGISGGLFFVPATESPGILAAIGYGIDQTFYIAKSSISGLMHMISGAISSCNLSGPLGIAETSGAAASQGAMSFVWFIAVLSTAVGLMNLFPIPVLDGGHLVFHAYEAVTGRPPSDRALRILMTAGFALLLTLMVFALGNDIFCP